MEQRMSSNLDQIPSPDVSELDGLCSWTVDSSDIRAGSSVDFASLPESFARDWAME